MISSKFARSFSRLVRCSTVCMPWGSWGTHPLFGRENSSTKVLRCSLRLIHAIFAGVFKRKQFVLLGGMQTRFHAPHRVKNVKVRCRGNCCSPVLFELPLWQDRITRDGSTREKKFFHNTGRWWFACCSWRKNCCSGMVGKAP